MILAMIAAVAVVIYWRVKQWNSLFQSLEDHLKSKGTKSHEEVP